MGAEVHYSPGVLLVNTSSITATFDGTVSISISASAGLLSVVCSLPDRYHNTTKGLLGEGTTSWATAASFLLQHGRRARCKVPFPPQSGWKRLWDPGSGCPRAAPERGPQSCGGAPTGVWDNNPADDFQMPNGTSIPVNSSEEEIFSYGMTCKARLGIHPGHPRAPAPSSHTLAGEIWTLVWARLVPGNSLVSLLLRVNHP